MPKKDARERGVDRGQIAGILLILAVPLYRLVQIGGDIDFVANIIGRPNWSAGVLALFASPPPWFLSLILLLGVGLILWGERNVRRRDMEGASKQFRKSLSALEGRHGFLEEALLAIREDIRTLHIRMKEEENRINQNDAKIAEILSRLDGIDRRLSFIPSNPKSYNHHLSTFVELQTDQIRREFAEKIEGMRERMAGVERLSHIERAKDESPVTRLPPNTGEETPQ